MDGRGVVQLVRDEGRQRWSLCSCRVDARLPPKNRLLPSKLADNTGLPDSENAGFSELQTAEWLQWLFVCLFFFVNFHKLTKT